MALYTCKNPGQKRMNYGFSAGLQSLDHETNKLRWIEMNRVRKRLMSVKDRVSIANETLSFDSFSKHYVIYINIMLIFAMRMMLLYLRHTVWYIYIYIHTESLCVRWKTEQCGKIAGDILGPTATAPSHLSPAGRPCRRPRPTAARCLSCSAVYRRWAEAVCRPRPRRMWWDP